ncbi:hypothetical protein O181_048753 [Austropuccinia psidii MF-1]|uniref:Uncharacterized protein n=1 Tax=Austropuccinia psidii MF-1 TaxID=1389203 RepID=A0A9Q3DYK4_9BASI|nr:hypothetical protein [Austropuccinia psidii MF-1]
MYKWKPSLPTNPEIVITQSTSNGISDIERQNIHEIVSLALQKQSSMYHAKMQHLKETIQKLQMEEEEEKDLPSKKTAKSQNPQPSMPNVNVKIKTVKSTKKEQFKTEIKEKGKYEKVVMANQNQKNWDRVSGRKAMEHKLGSSPA